MKSVWDKGPLVFFGTTPNPELIFKRLQPVDKFVHRPESCADVALMIQDMAAFSLRRCTFLAQQRGNVAQALGALPGEALFDQEESFSVYPCFRRTTERRRVGFLTAK